MKYFIDTEFIEGKQDKTFLGFKYGETKPTIDLISIGIKAEDNKLDNEPNMPVLNGREYYAISKDFNLEAAWKNEWVRENVLKKVFEELHNIAIHDVKRANGIGVILPFPKHGFTIKNLQRHLNKYGKTNKQITEEIIEFAQQKAYTIETGYKPDGIEFYGYYSDYDWVVFCQLFGTMMELPNGFPMYCKDLKQYLDDSQYERDWELTRDSKYPKQNNEHNALADAKWNYELYKFLKTI